MEATPSAIEADPSELTPRAVRAASRRSLARGDLLYGAHLVLCLDVVLWRTLGATPSLTALEGATWTDTIGGHALSFASELVGVLALVAVLVATWRSARSPRAWVLFAALALSMAWRERVDVFDLVYVGASVVLSLWWFREERVRVVERMLAVGV